MRLEFWKDGERVVCKAIHGDGRVGQVVVLTNIDFGEKPDLKEYPLARYPQPSIFVIIDKAEDYYVLRDADGNKVRVGDEHCGAYCGYLYDANAWARWNRMRVTEKLARKQRKIGHLEGQVALLKDVLVRQGTHDN